MNLSDLSKPFSDADLEWRVGQCGFKGDKPWAIMLPYVTARAVMDRLDQVVGVDTWQDTYHVKEKGVLCSLGINIGGDNGWIYKEDVGTESNTEAFKGSISDAFKRAAVKWGIGRYLYKTPTTFAKFVERGPNTIMARIKDKRSGKEETHFIQKPVMGVVKEAPSVEPAPPSVADGNTKPKDTTPPPTTPNTGAASDYVFKKGKFAGMNIMTVDHYKLTEWVFFMQSKGYTKGDDYKAAHFHLNSGSGDSVAPESDADVPYSDTPPPDEPPIGWSGSDDPQGPGIDHNEEIPF